MTTDQNTDQKKNQRKTFQIKFSCFYLDTTTTKNPTCHNKLTNKKLTLWWRAGIFRWHLLLCHYCGSPQGSGG